MTGFGHIIGDIRAATSNFRVAIFSHVRRKENSVAEMLEKKS